MSKSEKKVLNLERVGGGGYVLRPDKGNNRRGTGTCRIERERERVKDYRNADHFFHSQCPSRSGDINRNTGQKKKRNTIRQSRILHVFCFARKGGTDPQSIWF